MHGRRLAVQQYRVPPAEPLQRATSCTEDQVHEVLSEFVILVSMTIRAGCYLRISSDPNDKRAGVDRQREDTTALCEIKGLKPVDFYIDNDRSASNGKSAPGGTGCWQTSGREDRRHRRLGPGPQLAHDERAGRPAEVLHQAGPSSLLATTGQGDIDLYSPSGVPDRANQDGGVGARSGHDDRPYTRCR